MDIRNWPMDHILMLPDHCLSRRYSVFVCIDTTAEATEWDISELGLPDRAIIHELTLASNGEFAQMSYVRLALGEQLPTTTAQMDSLEPLFYGMGVQGPDPRVIRLSNPFFYHMNRLKMYVPAQGRRLILETTTLLGNSPSILAGVVVSAVPTEVPDCLLLG